LRRLILPVSVCLAAWTTPASAQAVRSRSADYIFAASANDARALWVNPAGLAIVPGASVMAEAVMALPVNSSARLAQWTLAMNTRGLSLGYQRDRFAEDPNTSTLRFGLALPFKRGGVGASFSFYGGSAVDSVSHRGIDFGARYRPLEFVDLGLVVRNIGRPTPRLDKAPIMGVLGATVTVVPEHAAVQLETVAAERIGASGVEMGYRGGILLSTGGRFPLSLTTALELDRDFKVSSWVLGIVVGGRDSGTALGSGPTGSGTETRLDRLSLTGVASRSFTQ
jgi:hypothetical protein